MVQPRPHRPATAASEVHPTGCCVCGAATHDRFALCYCCATLVGQLQMPLAPLVAMVDYRVRDQIHRRLRGYKDAPVAEARQMYLGQLSRFVDQWMAAHGSGLSRRLGCAWDVVTTVPSSRRPAGAPVDAIVARAPDLQGLHRRLLVRGPGPTGHLAAHRQGFSPAPDLDVGRLRDRTVLVVDDSVTTGARAQSAVAALWIAGVRVVGILAIGRAVAPDGTCPPGTIGGELSPEQDE